MQSLRHTGSIARGLRALAIMFLVSSATLMAQVPRELTYQGILRTTSGVLVNGLQSMRFNLYTSAVGGVPIWTETHTGINDVQVTNGLFSVRLGVITPFPATIDFSTQYWLETEYPLATPLAPRTQLAAAPYAIHAALADAIPGAYQWTLAGGVLFPSSPNTNIPVAVGGTGGVPPNPGRMNVWGDPSDLSALRIELSGAAAGNFTSINSGAINSPGTAIGLDLNSISSTGGNAIGAQVSVNGSLAGIGFKTNATSGGQSIGIDATANTTANVTSYGVKGSNTTPAALTSPQYGVSGSVPAASSGAGVYAQGAGTAGPGAPNAAALEINNGAFNITGPTQAAGVVGPFAALGPGTECSAVVNNNLVTPNSRILVTVQETSVGTPYVRMYAAVVSNIVAGSFRVNYYALPVPTGTCLAGVVGNAGVKIHYLIIGP